MKEKNILIKILFVIALVVFNSCDDDYLNLAPISTYSVDGFYKNKKDFEMAINGAYAPLRDLYNVWLVFTMRSLSDERTTEGSNSYSHHLINHFQIDPNSEHIRDQWRLLYTIVARCNLIIDRIDKIDYSDETRRSNIKGEAYFLRGFAYFHLGWLHGGVPLIDREMTVEEVKKIDRSTQTETFDFAAQDLITAATLLPEIWPSKELGKATKFSAQGLLARLYLLQNKFSIAKPLLQSIINSQRYQLADSYSHCFSDKYDNSPEHVFQVQYTSGLVGQGNSFPYKNAPENISRQDPFFPWGGHWDVVYASETLYNAYEDGDVRRDFNLQKGFFTLDGSYNEGILFIKYNHGTHGVSSGEYPINMPVLRYTDVKLMYAEVLNEENYNPDGDAFSILNEIRDRAGLGPITSADAPTQDAFREAMLNERRLEFAYEFLRWFDLYRTGKAMSVMNARPDAAQYPMKEYQYILPIPQHEMNVNIDRQIMWQNPGY